MDPPRPSCWGSIVVVLRRRGARLGLPNLVPARQDGPLAVVAYLIKHLGRWTVRFNSDSYAEQADTSLRNNNAAEGQAWALLAIAASISELAEAVKDLRDVVAD